MPSRLELARRDSEWSPPFFSGLTPRKSRLNCDQTRSIQTRRLPRKPSRPKPTPINKYVPGSGIATNGPEIRGWRTSLIPPATLIVVLTIDSPSAATIVRKLLPLPTVKPLNMTGASGVPLLETARTVIVDAPPVQFGHCPPMNGLIIRSPYVRPSAREIVRFVSGVPSGFAATRACPEDGSNRL